jgi:hypothetical protein
LDNVVAVNVGAVSPKIGRPFTFHWYVGEIPPLVGEAVNETLVPEQIAVAVDSIFTLAGKFGFTVIIILFEVVGDPNTHFSEEVITTETASLFVSVEDVNVGAVCPEIEIPFTFHWYVGEDPPLVGEAVNETLVPEQIAVAVDSILTLAGKLGFTTIVPVAFIDPQPPVNGTL